MGTAAGKEAQREDLRERIVEAARDIVSERGLDALSMRALALRIEHSPGTIYHHFQDKDEILRSVMTEGYKRLGAMVRAEVEELGPEASPLDHLAAMGRGYARFALGNTGYFRAMYEVPGVAQLDGCPELPAAPEGSAVSGGGPEDASHAMAVDLIRRAAERGDIEVPDPERAAMVGWGLFHGLTSLYMSGHLAHRVGSHEEFMELIESAIEVLAAGWRPKRGDTG